MDGTSTTHLPKIFCHAPQVRITTNKTGTSTQGETMNQQQLYRTNDIYKSIQNHDKSWVTVWKRWHESNQPAKKYWTQIWARIQVYNCIPFHKLSLVFRNSLFCVGLLHICYWSSSYLTINVHPESSSYLMYFKSLKQTLWVQYAAKSCLALNRVRLSRRYSR